ncbi:hypothetical protein C8F01DRAFT_1160894 [Mycena amicta]|nr:hypothetical protein C8F01DRAFT_1160894 [Mycena amicta]
MALRCLQWRDLKAADLGPQPLRERLRAECFRQAPWGAWIALSPPGDPHILRALRDLEPSEEVYVHKPIQIHEVAQWLKTSPSPDKYLIRRWDNYLSSVNQVLLGLQLKRQEKRKAQLTSSQVRRLLQFIRDRWARFTMEKDRECDSLKLE